MNERLKSILYPLLSFLFLLALWYVAIKVYKVPNYLLPDPGTVVQKLKLGYIDGAFLEHFAFTLQSMLYGYLLGCGAAFILGCLFAESRMVERILYPYVLALQSMPKVALAPLIIVWLGFDMASKVVMVALVCFFPMFINTSVGLKQVNPSLLDMMTAFSSSRWYILTRIKIPSAAGHIFAGLQIAIVLGLIGAVVAEFISSTKGLGFLINSSVVNLDTATMFAGLVSLAVIGICSSQAIRFLHGRVVFWDKPSSSKSAFSE